MLGAVRNGRPSAKVVFRVAPVPPKPDHGITWGHGAQADESFRVAAVDHGALAHGGDKIREGCYEHEGEHNARDDACGSPKLRDEHAPQEPEEGQGEPKGHNGCPEHDHAAAKLGAQKAQGSQGQQEECAGPQIHHNAKAYESEQRSLHPGMKVGEDCAEGEILHLDDGLGKRRVVQGGCASAAGVCGKLQVGVCVVDDGGEDFPLHHEQKDNAPQGTENFPVREDPAQVGLSAHDQDEHNAHENAWRACQGRKDIGERAEQKKRAASWRGKAQAQKAQKGSVVADEVGEDGVPLLCPPGDEAGKPKDEHPLPAQGVAQTRRLHGIPEKGSEEGKFGPGREQAQDVHRCQHVVHDPAHGGQGHEQGEEEGDKVRVVEAEQGAREKARSK